MAKEAPSSTRLRAPASRLLTLAKSARAEGDIEFADRFARLGVQAFDKLTKVSKKLKKGRRHK